MKYLSLLLVALLSTSIFAQETDSLTVQETPVSPPIESITLE